MNKLNEIDKYIAEYPIEVRVILEELRATIINAVPNGEEVMSYSMPAYKLNGILVWYAANKKHIGFYPTPMPILFFKEELSIYKTSKGAIQFPIDKPLPLDLISRIVQYRHEENLKKLKTKNLKKP